MRESVRRLFEDDPVQVTNAHAESAQVILNRVTEKSVAGGGIPAHEADFYMKAAQVRATLAVAQEIKDLRLALAKDS